MRSPTPPDKVFGFYWRALSGEREEIIEQEPHAGWWQIRLVKRGPWVPVRIWLEQEIGEDGELLGPEVVKCEIDNAPGDPLTVWTWCCRNPIEEHHYRYLVALRAWQRVNEPDLWNPYRPVDMTETPIEG
jgi:hypothetical protein